jgi:predicted phage terminase large subunit-like protein
VTEIDRVARAFYRQNLPCFVERVFRTLEPEKAYRHNWHIDHVCWQLSRVARGEIKRLIINVPPRSMKSITVTVGFTAWMLGRDPTKRIIAVSYADELARKLAIDTCTVIGSDWYRGLFPALQPRSAVQRRHEFVTSMHGYRFASGVGGAVLGRGGDLIVIDDPIKALDALSEAERRRVWEFYIGTLCTRLDDKRNGAIVIVMQRLHADDLVGRILDLEGEIWDVVSIPTIANEDKAFQLSDETNDVYYRRAGEVLHEDREPMSVLEAIRRAQGSLNFSAQYQQAPVPPGGNVIKRAWLRFYTTLPARFDRIIISWDTASTLSETSDWSVGTVWGALGLDFYLLEVYRERLESPNLRRAIIRLHERYHAAATLIEETELGRALAQDLYQTGHLRALTLRPERDKLARLLAQAARFEPGQVHLPENAPWLATYLNELLGFPNAPHDDQVDSTSQALNWLTSRRPPNQPIVRRDLRRRDTLGRRDIIGDRNDREQ